MATSVTLRLSNNANTFQTAKSTGFAIRGGVKFYDHESKKDDWTNYEAVVFASTSAQIDYYMQNLVEGAIVEVSANKLKIKTFNGQNGQKHSIELLNAEIGLIAQSVPRESQQQGGYQQPMQQGGYQQRPIQPQGGYQQPVQQGGYQQRPGQPQGNFNDM